jgi:Alpha amylase, catalytic domain.
MLHFLENHDEQRIASPFFAGDAWKAVPAMVISATIDQGPLMIFFGQEVGEPGAGAEGLVVKMAAHSLRLLGCARASEVDEWWKV